MLDPKLGTSPVSSLGVVADGGVSLVVVPARHGTVLAPSLAQNAL